MKTITLIAILTTVGICGIHYNSNHIVKQVTDDRGLTSVIFIQDGKEWGLDYLTKYQVDSLTKALSN